MRLSEGIESLRRMGFKVIVGETLRRALRHWFYSAPPEVRAEELNRAFKNPGIDAIFCARGGVGALRLLDLLDYDVIRENPKPLVGYSDITALHNAIYAKTGVPGLQAVMVATRPHISFGEEDAARVYRYNLELAVRILKGETLELRNPPDAPSPKTIVPGRARGTGVGGNIIIYTLLQATGYSPDPRGSILFLENIEEPSWRVDDYLASLGHSGVLREVNGLVFGEFPEPSSYSGPSPSVEEVIAHYALTQGKPSFMDYSCCHGRYVLPFPVGLEVEIDADEGVVRMLEPLTE